MGGVDITVLGAGLICCSCGEAVIVCRKKSVWDIRVPGELMGLMDALLRTSSEMPQFSVVFALVHVL